MHGSVLNRLGDTLAPPVYLNRSLPTVATVITCTTESTSQPTVLSHVTF